MQSNKKVKKKSVIVSHPSRILVSYNCALALQEAGLLLRYETGFFFKKFGFTNKLLIKLLPEKYYLRIVKQLNRRAFSELKLVKNYFFFDILFSSLSKIIRKQSFLHRLIRIRNDYFDWRVSRSIRKLRPSAVVAYDSSARITFKAAKKLGVVCILDQVVGDIRYGSALLEKDSKLYPEFATTSISLEKEWAIKRCEDETSLADLILVPSEYVKQTLIDNGVAKSKIEIVPYGSDITNINLKTRKKDNSKIRFMFVGHICQRKGVHYLLEAFSCFKTPNVELVMVGESFGEYKLLKKYSNLFTHIKPVIYSDLIELYRTADVFVIPSLHEGSALVVYDALAAGLPVITTFNTGSVVRDNEEGFIVPIRDTHSLFKKMELLSKDSKLRNEMSQKAIKRARLYTWEAYRLKVSQVIKNYLK